MCAGASPLWAGLVAHFLDLPMAFFSTSFDSVLVQACDATTDVPRAITEGTHACTSLRRPKRGRQAHGERAHEEKLQEVSCQGPHRAVTDEPPKRGRGGPVRDELPCRSSIWRSLAAIGPFGV